MNCYRWRKSDLCEEFSGKEAEKGSSTEKALLEFATRCGLNISEINERYPRIETRFRTEDRHSMATLHGAGTAKRFLAVKGNPVEVLAMCEFQLLAGQKLPIGEPDLSNIISENERMAGGPARPRIRVPSGPMTMKSRTDSAA